MSTYLEMQTKIADDLNRSDLGSQIQREILRAIRKFSKNPFWFSSKRLNFATAIGQQYYDSSDDLPTDIRVINYIRINQSSETINTDTGAADAYTFATTPATTSYSDGDVFVFKAGAANTGASTLNIDSVGVADISRPNGVALQVGDILANQIVTVVYESDASDFFLQEKGGTYYELKEVGIDVIAKRNVNDNPGLPLSYAWFDSQLYLYPTPDQIYVVDIFYQQYYADLSADADTNDFTINYEAENLIEQEAEYQLYNTTILDTSMAQKCLIARDEALSTCRQVTNNFIGRHGKIRATGF
tara:strand:+ start:25216 stop:26118 length:903 start_codon:yes stop_codon:yes gene_type:complete